MSGERTSGIRCAESYGLLHRYLVSSPCLGSLPRCRSCHADDDSFSDAACRAAIELAEQEEIQDHIRIDCKDLLSLSIEELRPLHIQFISTSAAMSDIHLLRLLQVAIQLGVNSLLLPQSSLKNLLKLEVLDKRRRSRDMLFAEATLESSQERRNIFRIATSEEENAQNRLGNHFKIII